jgi:cation diffusion facilitator family transporter
MGRERIHMVDRSEASRAAALSILAALLLTTMKLVAGIVSNSLGLISEALHSGLDLLAAGITFIAVKKASEAPDQDHPYGHGKIENFSALAETFILWVTAVWIILEAWRRIVEQEWAQPTLIGIAIMVTSIIVDYERSRMLYRAASKFNSQALEADALHFSTDMLSSAVVLAGLGLLWFGFPLGDPLGALGVSVVIFVISFRLAKRSYDHLVDRVPKGVEERVIEICSSIPGVVNCHRVRARTSGADLFVDAILDVDKDISVTDAHSIADLAEKRMSALGPHVDCTIHIEPSDHSAPSDSEEVNSSLQALARANPHIHSLHNLRVLHMHDGVHISADLEMDPNLILRDAHKISDDFEHAVTDAIPSVLRMTFHLESTESSVEAVDITGNKEDLARRIRTRLLELYPECEIRDLHMSENGIDMTISLTCAVDGSMTLHDGHTLSEQIEFAVKKLSSSATVIVHMEPI